MSSLTYNRILPHHLYCRTVHRLLGLIPSLFDNLHCTPRRLSQRLPYLLNPFHDPTNDSLNPLHSLFYDLPEPTGRSEPTGTSVGRVEFGDFDDFGCVDSFEDELGDSISLVDCSERVVGKVKQAPERTTKNEA